MMEVKGISKSFDRQKVLHNIDLRVDEATTTAVLGKSGCGKTTLLKIIAGLEQCDTGQVWLNGVDKTDIPTQQRQAVYMFQEPMLFPHLSVKGNVEFGLRHKVSDPKQIAARSTELIEKLGLSAHAHKMPHQLSGGQRQRVNFGRAIITQPSVLLLDEPFGNLDAGTRTQMQELFKDLAATYSVTALFVTHDLKEALLMGDEMAYMEDGSLYLYPSKEDFLADERTGGAREMAFWKKYIHE